MERWFFDPKWSAEEAMLEQLKWFKQGKPDGRDRGPFNAWNSTKKLEWCGARHEAGYKRAILDGVFFCALDDLPMPRWLTVAYIEAFGSVISHDKKDWSDVFGCAHKKGTNIKAEQKKWRLSPDVFMHAKEILCSDPKTVIDNGFYEQVGSKFNIGKTLAQEYITDFCRDNDYKLRDV